MGKIREARKDDAVWLRGLMEQLSGQTTTVEDVLDRLQFIENSKIDFMFVYEDEGRVLGLMAFRIRENIEKVSKYGEISAIVVDENYRGRGIGRLMVEYAETLAKEMGCTGTWLVSSLHREKDAHKFYKHLGYEITGYRFVKLF